ncbi:hypothetical protein NH8B_2278 [Pseudogulbenkiania sp. NH8B]|uniref:hypothetical protein n=1 Tax=Pseudogulbenkiania sp. (strain NH8B) TaxID=748280 RepID=UPI0002279D9C|nr:hypothetical protein [Pseudogulbenkiania sp. NH8B]BAK77092.1 hypothetical protein NH8B_2278 [Pseudogulbenkiania sp. NH8B]
MLIDMLRWLAFLAVTFGGVYWLMYGRKTGTRKTTGSGFWRYRTEASENDGYSRLLTACLGNRDKAERLIGLELRQNPALNRDTAIQRALERLQYDRS